MEMEKRNKQDNKNTIHLTSGNELARDIITFSFIQMEFN